MKKRTQYSDEFRASALVLLEFNGWPSDRFALKRASTSLGVPVSTLSSWWNGSNQPPAKIRNIKKGEVIDAMHDEVWATLQQMGKVRSKASYRDLAVALGIIIDKYLLLSGEESNRTEDVTEQIKVLMPWQYDDDDDQGEDEGGPLDPLH